MVRRIYGLPRGARREGLPVLHVEKEERIKIGTPVSVSWCLKDVPGVFVGYVWSKRPPGAYGRELREAGLSPNSVTGIWVIESCCVSIYREETPRGYIRGTRVMVGLDDVDPSS